MERYRIVRKSISYNVQSNTQEEKSVNMRKDKTKPTGIAWTFREERKREQEKAIKLLEKFKKIESNTPMYCTTYKGMRVCAKTEERLNEIVEQLKNR